jgi:hypothetical protein
MKAEGKVPGKDFAVIDVRGEDHAGGHIKGAIHQSSKTLPHGGVEEIREKTKNVPTVIFHCLLSQVRLVFLQLSARLALTIGDQRSGVRQGMLATYPWEDSSRSGFPIDVHVSLALRYFHRRTKAEWR